MNGKPESTPELREIDQKNLAEMIAAKRLRQEAPNLNKRRDPNERSRHFDTVEEAQAFFKSLPPSFRPSEHRLVSGGVDVTWRVVKGLSWSSVGAPGAGETPNLAQGGSTPPPIAMYTLAKYSTHRPADVRRVVEFTDTVEAFEQYNAVKTYENCADAHLYRRYTDEKVVLEYGLQTVGKAEPYVPWRGVRIPKMYRINVKPRRR